VLGTHRRAGAIADVRVRQAINYAVDKVAYRDAVAGRFAPTGELASTILAPGSLGYHHYDLYPTPGGRSDPAKARALLADAGYPNGLALTFVAWAPAATSTPSSRSGPPWPRAGIRLKVKTYKENDLFDEQLAIPAKRLEHQVGQGIWALD
jgi:peptide/nickel transport system substrate-binding protein